MATRKNTTKSAARKKASESKTKSAVRKRAGKSSTTTSKKSGAASTRSRSPKKAAAKRAVESKSHRESSPTTLGIAFFPKKDIGGGDRSAGEAGGGGPVGGKDELKLKDFFESVTDSVVNAQRQLNTWSLAYAREAQSTSIPPALYSIPTVKAEVKLGFAKDEHSNLVVKVFGSPEEQSSYGESTVSFDIVASPPPPGATDFKAPIPPFLVVESERNAVFDAIAPALDGAARNRAVVIRNPSGQNACLAMIPGEGKVDLYRVSPDGTASRVGTEAAETAAFLSEVCAAIRAWEQSIRAAW